MDLQRLRRETAADHDRIEQLIPLMDPTLTLQQYITVLARLYGWVKSWDDWALLHGPEDLLPTIASRGRSDWLARDLACLNVPVSLLEIAAPWAAPMTRPAFLGAMYVMEGSTLGGQYIAAHVEQSLPLQHGQGDAYFVGHGDRTGAMWREFQAMLRNVRDEDGEAVIAAAQHAFRRFGVWMQTPHGEGLSCTGTGPTVHHA